MGSIAFGTIRFLESCQRAVNITRFCHLISSVFCPVKRGCLSDKRDVLDCMTEIFGKISALIDGLEMLVGHFTYSLYHAKF